MFCNKGDVIIMNYYSLLQEIEERQFIVDYDEKYIEKEILCYHASELLAERMEMLRANHFRVKETATSGLEEESQLLNSLSDEEKKKIIFSDYKLVCKDNLEKYLGEEKSDTFYYVGINQFVLDYYKDNPKSEWKIKAVLQLGFPFGFVPAKKEQQISNKCFAVKKYFKNKSWSLFIFTKNDISDVVLGFDDRNKYAYSEQIYEDLKWLFHDRAVALSNEKKEKPYSSLLYVTKTSDETRDKEIIEYLKTDMVQEFTNEQIRELGYSFNKIPSEYFKIDYLDYLSRYKKSVIEVFGYPDKKEKIKPLMNVVKFIKTPNKRDNDNSRYGCNSVLVEGLFFRDETLKIKPHVGYDLDEECWWYEDVYIIDPCSISPYYLYCLFSSELINDYYADRFPSSIFDGDYYLPLEGCIYIQMSPEKMNSYAYKDKYELDTNSKLKVQNILDSKELVSPKAKVAINKFLVEIHDAIKNKLYYSATIVMGSVLEAFLIDWLSEIDGKDYFNEPYLIPEKGNKRADLIDYIDIIQKKRPDWIDGAKKATNIRKKRNTVHAKLYIEEKEISEATCINMLNDLEAIIHNRWKQ